MRRFTRGFLGAIAVSVLTVTTVFALTINTITIDCIGDTVFGDITVTGTVGEDFNAVLLTKASGGDQFAPSGDTDGPFTLTGEAGATVTQTFRYTFDISASSNVHFKVTTDEGSIDSPSLNTVDCEPGEYIPEAPMAILLPIAALAVGGGLLFLR